MRRVVEELALATPEEIQKDGKFCITAQRNDQGQIELWYDDGQGPERMSVSGVALERIVWQVALRNGALRLLALERAGEADPVLEERRAQLRAIHTRMVQLYGDLHARVNRRLFAEDAWAPLLLSLESPVATEDAQGRLELKYQPSGLLLQRQCAPVQADSWTKAWSDSLLHTGGQLDIADLASRLGVEPEEAAQEVLRRERAFRDPLTGQWMLAERFLSGPVRQRLALVTQLIEKEGSGAAVGLEELKRAQAALQRVLPPEVTAQDIVLFAQATWYPAEYVRQFVARQLRIPEAEVSVQANPEGDGWNVVISERGQRMIPVTQATEYGLPSAQEGRDGRGVTTATLFGHAFSGRPYKPFRRGPNDERVLDYRMAMAGNLIIERIRAEFQDWVWQDSGRAQRLTAIYNERFNAMVPPEPERHMGDFVFPGLSLQRSLRRHQQRAAWRIFAGHSTLLDHCVGAGKTAACCVAASAAHASRQRHKTLICVPNHLVEQWRREYQETVPGARILVLDSSQFSPARRARTLRKIQLGSWEAVIVPESVIGVLTPGLKREADLLRQELERLDNALGEVRSGPVSRISRGRERSLRAQKERCQSRLEDVERRLQYGGEAADEASLERLGITRLIVDEAHGFKNLPYTTALQVAGLNPVGSAKAAHMYRLTQAIHAANGGQGGVTFATATPYSNSIAEIYALMRFLAPAEVSRLGLTSFDAWASLFCEPVTAWEVDATGSRFALKTRLARFVNLPEMMRIYNGFADVVSRQDLDRYVAEKVGRPQVPGIRGGAPQPVFSDRTPAQAEYIGYPCGSRLDPATGLVVEEFNRGSIAWRASHATAQDNLLRINMHARMCSLDMRLVDPNAREEDSRKLDSCVAEVLAIYRRESHRRGVQLIFCDLSVPKGAVSAEAARIEMLRHLAEQGDEEAAEKLNEISPDVLMAVETARSYSVYDDLKRRLVAGGIPEHEIAFIHDAHDAREREELFHKTRAGLIRVLIGSTPRMGPGANVQDRLVALHHLDVTYRPSDMEQRLGRILREGNLFFAQDPGFEVDVKYYVTRQTYDARMWQIQENKLQVQEQLRRGCTLRETEDIGFTLASVSEIKALASGNPLLLEQVRLADEVRRLELERSAHTRRVVGLHQAVAQYDAEISWWRSRLQRADRMRSLLETRMDDFPDVQQVNAWWENVRQVIPVLRDRHERMGTGFSHSPREVCPFTLMGLTAAWKMSVTSQSVRLELAAYEPEAAAATGSLTLQDAVFFAATEVLWKGDQTPMMLKDSLDGLWQNLRQKAAALLAERKTGAEKVAALEAEKASCLEQLQKPFPRLEELEQKKARLQTINLALASGRRLNSASDQVVEIVQAAGQRPEQRSGMRSGLRAGVDL